MDHPLNRLLHGLELFNRLVVGDHDSLLNLTKSFFFRLIHDHLSILSILDDIVADPLLAVDFLVLRAGAGEVFGTTTVVCNGSNLCRERLGLGEGSEEGNSEELSQMGDEWDMLALLTLFRIYKYYHIYTFHR